MFDAILSFMSPRGGDEFVPVEAGQLVSVNGKALMIAAYSVLLAALLIYSISLLWRERKISRELGDLKSSIDKSR